MKKLLLTFFVTILFSYAYSIDMEQATRVAQNFLKNRNIEATSSLYRISLQEVVQRDNANLFYIMDLGDKEGFIIVSGSKFVHPIIGYSFDNEFEWQPAIKYYLELFADYILSEEQSKNIPDEQVTNQWDNYLQEDFVSNTTRGKAVLPLITSRWNQDKFYNRYCPWDVRVGSGSYDYRVPNGCVALAAAQLMNYWRHPEKGTGRWSYIHNLYGTQSVSFSNHEYHWDAMTDRATNLTNEISKIAYHLGVAVSMGYAPGGSGAQTKDVADALHKYFGYTEATPWTGYNAWDLLSLELDSLRPFIMSGCSPSSPSSCHAFLLDGYNTDVDSEGNPVELFHFNWGWAGSSDGYFMLNNHLFSDGAGTFIRIQPATNYPVQCQSYKRQTAFEGYVTNGSTNKPYDSAPDCSWIIAAPGATQYTFSFSRLETLENIDEVTIYNGATKSSGVAGSFSGSITPTQKVTVAADSVLITFTTKDPSKENVSNRGFLMTYFTNKPQQKCDGINYVTDSGGYITDGTKDGENYSPWTSCTWNIAPENSSGFFGLFHKFDLNLGDYVEIYNANETVPVFWRRFDRNSSPTVGEAFNIPFSKIEVRFLTDNFEQGEGFKFQYYALLGINDNSLLDNLTIYPNPTSDFINLSFSSPLINQNIQCRIVDLAGKEVYFSNIEYSGDFYTGQIPVSHLAKGLYFLQLVTPAGKTVSKIVVN